MKEERITCDNCYADLVVDSSYPAHYTLELSCKNTGINTSGAVYAVHIIPTLSRNHQFCGIKCLQNWLKEYYNEN